MAQFRYNGPTEGLLAVGFSYPHHVKPDDVFSVPDDQATAYVCCNPDGTPGLTELYSPLDSGAIAAADAEQARVRAIWLAKHPEPVVSAPVGTVTAASTTEPPPALPTPTEALSEAETAATPDPETPEA